MLERLPTKLEGVVLLGPTVHGDERGFMVETYRRDLWAEHGVEVEFVQHNHSRSSKGTLRGLHFQTEPGQAKLVRCPRGRIFDVAVDLRRGSPTYGEWDDPGVGVEWPVDEPLLSERDKTAPTLAEVGETLPF
ncbi:MAG TPA: dTDP-4-dehydrorhamnose 3,5-epimerase family protein [Solirubrobacterales bacterium]|nr:dTDP-4-dehydrorhamnose 3,5-epimerase family protein [Solirubrobacterales bacterium]